MNRLFNAQQEKEICEEYQSGKSTSAIAKSRQTGHKVILGVLRRNQVEIRGRHAPRVMPYEEVFSLYAAGYSYTQIAKQFGVSKSSVQGAIGRHRPSIKRSVGEAVSARDKTEPRQWPNGKPNLKGSNNPLWKGGVTQISFAIRSSATYKKWRAFVFEHDQYTCQLCGAKTRPGKKVILHADHIYPLSKIIQDNKIDSLEAAIRCDAVWDVSNGRCLCRSCHKKTDTYGVNCGATVRPEESKSRKAGATKQKLRS